MSLISALYTGVSGLQTYGDSLQTIGDNIANVNTTAFKSSRAEFADVLNQSINVASGNSQIGRGVTLSRISTDFAQGSFSNTDRMTDLAINGNGFFVVNDGNRDFYTRNGQFSINNKGDLVTSSGLTLRGKAYDTSGVQSQSLSAVNVSAATSAPNKTGDGTIAGSGVNISANLNSTDPVKTFDPANPATTSNLSTSVTVYDALGQSHVVNVYFNKLATPTTGTGIASSWAWHASADGATPLATDGGTLDFNSSGTMVNTPATPATVSFGFITGAAAQSIGFNFAGNGSSQLPTTQWASASAIESQSQDGYASGSLTSIAVGEDGVVTGTFSNGRNAAISQIALANFANLQGLHRDGNGLYSETTDSGSPAVTTPTLGGTGTIASYSLELSNVDLANEFVNLISTQRAYQANSKVITTGDQLLQEIVNIIR